jgi:hypothetical protein
MTGGTLTLVMLILWPILALPAGVFSQGYFTMWIVVSLKSQAGSSVGGGCHTQSHLRIDGLCWAAQSLQRVARTAV